MFKFRFAFMLMLSFFILGLAACGEDKGDEAAGGGEAKEEAAKPATPEELSKAIFDVYMEGLDAVVAMSDAPPPLEEAKAALEPLKENMITKLVALGRQVEAMDDGQKAQVNAALSSAMMHVEQDKFNKYSEMVTHYRAEDNDFANFISSLNIITQYAFFDLLKKQAPEEAARLGIE